MCDREGRFGTASIDRRKGDSITQAESKTTALRQAVQGFHLFIVKPVFTVTYGTYLRNKGRG